MLNTHLRSAVRVKNGNSCGSGSIFYNEDFCLILTNAHVAGSRLGRTVTVEPFWDSDTYGQDIRGRVVAAGYRRGTNIDFAVIKCPRIEGAQAVRLSRDGRCSSLAPAFTGGSPRCEPTSYRIIHWQRNTNSEVYAFLPDAIGGMSGSGIWQNGLQVGLITWSNGRVGLCQSLKLIYSVLKGERAAVASIPADWQPACDNPCNPQDNIQFEAAEIPDSVWGSCTEEPEKPQEPIEDPGAVMGRLRDLLRKRPRNWLAIIQLLLDNAPQIIDFITRIIDLFEDGDEKTCVDCP